MHARGKADATYEIVETRICAERIQQRVDIEPRHPVSPRSFFSVIAR